MLLTFNLSISISTCFAENLKKLFKTPDAWTRKFEAKQQNWPRNFKKINRAGAELLREMSRSDGDANLFRLKFCKGNVR